MTTISCSNHSSCSVKPDNFPRASQLAKTAVKVGLVIAKLTLIGALATGVVAGTVAASAAGGPAGFGACAALNFVACVITHKVIKHTKSRFEEDCPLLSAARKAFGCSAVMCGGGVIGSFASLAWGFGGAAITGALIGYASQHDQHGGS